MGFRFSRRISIFKGLRLNLSKSGTSVSLGGRGAWLTFGKRGAQATVGIPGTGMSWREKIKTPPLSPAPQNAPQPGSNPGPNLKTALRLIILIGLLGLILYSLVSTI